LVRFSEINGCGAIIGLTGATIGAEGNSGANIPPLGGSGMLGMGSTGISIEIGETIPLFNIMEVKGFSIAI